MPSFVYHGDHAAVAPFGIVFPAGVAVNVTSEAVIAKLRGNRAFVEVFDGVEVVIEPVAPQAQPAPKRRGRPPKARGE